MQSPLDAKSSIKKSYSNQSVTAIRTEFSIYGSSTAPATINITSPGQSLARNSCGCTVTKSRNDSGLSSQRIQNLRNTGIGWQGLRSLRSTSQQTGTRRTRVALTSSSTHSSTTILEAGLNCSLQGASLCHNPGDLRARNIVLILGNCDCSQNTNDRNYDHQFNQSKTLLCFHEYLHIVCIGQTPSPNKAVCMPTFQSPLFATFAGVSSLNNSPPLAICDTF